MEDKSAESKHDKPDNGEILGDGDTNSQGEEGEAPVCLRRSSRGCEENERDGRRGILWVYFSVNAQDKVW